MMPIVASTEAFIMTKLAPVAANKSLVIIKEGKAGISKKNNPKKTNSISIAFFVISPVNIRGYKKETIAIDKSLIASKILAADSVKL
ncbi:MAG: hypothetical protein ABJB11_12155 [Ferruginibacter sp.]